MMTTIKEGIAHISKCIDKACKKSGRNPQDVQLMLATKTVTADRILAAFSFGCTLIGENKVQELRKKAAALESIPHTTHFIGHLQSNKIHDAIRYASCIQSVDSATIAKKIEQRLAMQNRHMDILIQVNTSNEKTKSGCTPQETLSLVRTIAKFPHLTVKGLMTIGIQSQDTYRVRNCFACLKKLQQQLQEAHIENASFEVLSMGMSGDFEIAIEEGSTLVRIGSAVFGNR